MQFSDRVKALNIPLDQIVVIGSGIVDQLGFRTANDIDLVVSPQVLEAAEASGAYTCGIRGTDNYCRRQGVELWSNWGESLPYDTLAENAIVIDGVSFASPEVVIGQKHRRGTDKDRQDITWLRGHYGL